MTRGKRKVKAERKPAARKHKETLPAIIPTEPQPTTPIHTNPIKEITESEIIQAFDILGITAKLNDQQKRLFIAVAREYRLNPLKREIHAVSMGKDDDDQSSKTLVPVVGYEVYIKRAEATGRLEYWNTHEEGSINRIDWKGSDYKVTVEIKRKDQPKPFLWTVRYVECVALKWVNGTPKPNRMWDKRGYFMTMKCGIGQAFRLLFPEVLGEMPYIDAEIANQAEIENQEPERKLIAEPQPTAGVTVDTSGRVETDKLPALGEFLSARQEVQDTFTKISKSVRCAKCGGTKAVEGNPCDACEDANGAPTGWTKLYSPDELKKMMAQAAGATEKLPSKVKGKFTPDDYEANKQHAPEAIRKLNGIAIEWTADYTNRLADHGFKEGERK